MKSIVRLSTCLLFLTIGIVAPSALAVNKVLSLDGDGDYVDCGTSNIFNFGSGDSTVEVWIYFNTVSGEQAFVEKASDLAAVHGWAMTKLTNNRIRFAQNQNRHFPVDSKVTVSANRWYHIAMVRDSASKMMTGYIDGQIVVTDVFRVLSDTSNPLWIGERFGVQNFPVNGFIDEVRIWSVARTQAEIQSTMDTAFKGDEPGLIGYWNFDDGTADDSSPYSNHGTLIGEARIQANETLVIKPPIIPFSITRVTPTQGGNSGFVTMTVKGAQFQEGATVKLVKVDAPNVVLEPDETTFVNSGRLVARFNLQGAQVGQYDVVVTNPDGQTATLPAGFEVIQGGKARLWGDIVGRETVRAGRDTMFTLLYGNRGNVDAGAPLLVLSGPKGSEFRFTPDSRPYSTPLRLLGVGDSASPTWLRPGETRSITVFARIPSGIDSVTFELGVFDTAGKLFDWNRFAAEAVPTGSSPADWAARVVLARARIGESWDNVMTVVRQVGEQQELDPNVLIDFDRLMRFIVFVYGTNAEEFSRMLGGRSATILFSHARDVDISQVKVIPVQEVPNATQSFIITHGYGGIGSESGDAYEARYFNLAKEIMRSFPNANVYLVDWSPLARDKILGLVPNFWAVSARIDAVGDAAFNRLRERGVDGLKSTFWGESFANYVNHDIAENFARINGIGVDKILAGNPASEMGMPKSIPPDRRPPDLRLYSNKAWGFHTYSIADTQRDVGDHDLFLETPPDFDSIQQHSSFMQWAANRLRAGDRSWLNMEKILANAPQGFYDGTVHWTDGSYTPSPFAQSFDTFDGTIASNPTKLGQRHVRIVQAIDPNDKGGPAGYNPEGIPEKQRKRFIAADGSLPYMVFFENLETATAAVQDMLITDQLDSNLDWSTFSLGMMQVGEKIVSVPEEAQNFTTTVDLRPTISAVVEVDCKFNPSTGRAEWRFRGKDSDTGELADFLPPNKEDVDPRGGGWISYSVKPKQNLPTGTVIKNMATIDFEVGVPPAPMDTPEVFNTIDSGAPTSFVKPLPTETSFTTFTVEWEGKDDENGSGIRDYTIYVSEDGNVFNKWLSHTTQTSATFTGELGRTYYFYSCAEDNVGNTEKAPSKEDSIIKVAIPTGSTLSLSKGINLISVPLKPEREMKLSDLLSQISENATMAIWYDEINKKFMSYRPQHGVDAKTNAVVSGGKGYIVIMAEAGEVTFEGKPWDGKISLSKGINLISVPLKPEKEMRLSDLLSQIGENATMAIWYDEINKKFMSYRPQHGVDAKTNAVVSGGKGYIVIMAEAGEITFEGEPWDNTLSASPPMAFFHGSLHSEKLCTPILTVEGNVNSTLNGIKVTVENLVNKLKDSDVTSAMVVDGKFLGILVSLTGSYAAQEGDVLQITSHLSEVFEDAEDIQIRHTVTKQEIERCIVLLGDILPRVVPKKNLLLQNYPNPFNPETWIPFALAEDSEVAIRIYDMSGRLVRKLNLGRLEAGYYISRNRAVHWDGRNELGEHVASGVYFYQMNIGKKGFMKKMAMLK